MSTQGADDRLDSFIAGEDRLAALLRVLPAYEPPAAMATQFAALARAAQRHHQPAAATASAVAPMSFEVPASLEAGFLAEAARIQSAQQPRHDAVIEQIQSGKSVSEVLGHDVAEATAQWLAARPQRIADQAKTPERRPAGKWWQRVGVVMASIAFGIVATNLWLAQRPQAGLPATAMSEAPVAAPAGSAPGAAPTTGAGTGAPLPPAVALRVEPIAQISALSRSGNYPGAGDSKQRVEQRLREFAAEAKRAAKAEAELDAADRTAADKTRRDATQDRVREQEQQLERRAETLAMASAKPAPVAEERMGAAPPPPPAAAGAAAPQERRVVRPAAPVASIAAPAPAVTAAPAAVPAPKAAADRASATLRFDTGSSAQDAAHAWVAHTRERAPRIFAANPESDAVRSWVERLRQALPAEIRPAQIRIEQDTRLREDALRFE